VNHHTAGSLTKSALAQACAFVSPFLKVNECYGDVTPAKDDWVGYPLRVAKKIRELALEYLACCG
jgi:hypothetical protein